MKKNTLLKILLIFILVSFIFSFAEYINKLHIQEKELNEEIEKLTLENQELLSEVKKLKDPSYKSEFHENSTKENYNYLAIGNSITWHRICDYWWDEFGMAASSEENDYYHLVLNGLENKYNNVNAKAYSFIPWETLNTDRAETLELLDGYLNDNLDLITIQLGENVTDSTTFESDFLYLVQYIKVKATNSKIIIVGNFWRNDDIEKAKVNVSGITNVMYVDLSEIQDKPEYRNEIGGIVYSKNGESHNIDNGAVAMHPNDKAMKYIAEKILELI